MAQSAAADGNSLFYCYTSNGVLRVNKSPVVAGLQLTPSPEQVPHCQWNAEADRAESHWNRNRLPEEKG